LALRAGVAAVERSAADSVEPAPVLDDDGEFGVDTGGFVVVAVATGSRRCSPNAADSGTHPR